MNTKNKSRKADRKAGGGRHPLRSPDRKKTPNYFLGLGLLNDV